MDTGLGRFLQTKKCAILLLLVLVFAIVFCSVVTAWAILKATGSNVLHYIPYLAFIIMVLMILSQLIPGEKKAPIIYRAAVSFVTCFCLYDFMYLFVYEVLEIFMRLKGFVWACGVFICTGGAILTVIGGAVYARVIKETSYDITVEGLSKDCRIALISDLHMGIYVRSHHIKRTVDKINSFSPDLVLIAGDIVDVDNRILSEPKRLKQISGIFRGIKSKEGVYATLGNHDPNIEENPLMRQFLEDSHITLLHNETVELENMNLMGRTDDTHNERKTMEEMMENVNKDKPLIIMDHNPQGIKEATEYGADLVVSGHTHKGQFFPLTIFTELANGKHYFYGHETYGKTQAVITSGIGFFQLPIRIGSSSEAVEINLSSGKKQQEPEK